MSGEIPLAACRRILVKGGASRVSPEAAEALEAHLVVFGTDIGRRAAGLAAHAGRTTIKAEDVEAAIRAQTAAGSKVKA